MVQFDNQYRQIKVKVVYYGPALGGKTTCLKHIHGVIDPERRTKLYSLNTASDRTLFFDLMGLDLGRVRGYQMMLQLYTVPGQVQYDATRRAVLAGADGIVFVADSQTSQRQANTESLQDLAVNLEANGLDWRRLAQVLQYNKRDLSPVLPVEELDSDLNTRNLPAFPSVATTGEGVMEAFVAITERTLESIADRLGLSRTPDAVDKLMGHVRTVLQPFTAKEPTDLERDEPVVTRAETAEQSQPLPEEQLVHEAVRANVSATDLNARLDILQTNLQRKVRALEALAHAGDRLRQVREPAEVVDSTMETISRVFDGSAGAVLLTRGGPLQEAATRGSREDLILNTIDGTGESLAIRLLNERRPLLFASSPADSSEDRDLALESMRAKGYGSAIVAPMLARDDTIGLLTAYREIGHRPFDEDDSNLLGILGTAAAIAYEGARGWRRLRELNEDLEGQVVERTDRLDESHRELQALAAELEAKNRYLEQAYRELADVESIKGELLQRISQELKAPITSLLTCARILSRQRDELPDKSGRFVDVMVDEAEKLDEIMDGVLQGSVLMAVDSEPELETLSPTDLLKRTLAPLRDLAGARKVKLTVRVAPELDTIPCEPSTLQAALHAIIKNAVEHSARGDSVVIEIRRRREDDRQVAVFQIRDNGVGIPENELPHVFHPFWQGGNVLSGKPQGLGLGLTIAKRAVERVGGRIEIKSVMGEGTSVTATLPLDLESTAQP